MSDLTSKPTYARQYWLDGAWRKAGVALAGVVAIFLAIKAMSYSQGSVVDVQDHLFRLFAFASLTVWIALCIGVKRRGTAAMIVLAFASFVELVILPGTGQSMGTLATANLGIVVAYCGLQLYWYRITEANAETAVKDVDMEDPDAPCPMSKY